MTRNCDVTYALNSKQATSHGIAPSYYHDLAFCDWTATTTDYELERRHHLE